MSAAKLFAEAIASARSQIVVSSVSIVTIATMILAIMLTTGRTVGAETRVLDTIDATGTRSIIYRAEPGAGLTAGVLERIANISGIEWAGALTAATDGSNAHNLDGEKIAVRELYTLELARIGLPEQPPLPGELAYLSHASRELLGLSQFVGAITLTDGRSFGIGGEVRTPDFLARFEPMAIVPHSTINPDTAIHTLVVVAERPELVGAVADTVASLSSVEDPTKLSVNTSEALASLRALVGSQFASFSRGLVLVLLGIAAALISALLYGLVMIRRKDYGRRRALGASRSFVMLLLLTQTAVLASIGIAIGLASSLVTLLVMGEPLPEWPFVLGLATLALTVSLIATLLPATVASRRDPIRELRVA